MSKTTSIWKVKFFLLFKLPAAFFSGVKLVSLNDDMSEVSIRYKWFNTNPFGSIYFACLAMAAEFASGILAFHHVRKSGVPISMLVTKLEASFLKKATGTIRFICPDGAVIQKQIEKCIATGEGVEILINTVGLNADNEQVVNFDITWSFKKKK